VNEHLALAKQYLAIAESKDAKREAYMAAAREIALHRAETGATYADIAISLGRSKDYPKRLVDWLNTDFKATTPFLMDESATARAAMSHTRSTLRNADPTEIAELLDDPEISRNVAKAREVQAFRDSSAGPSTKGLTPIGYAAVMSAWQRTRDLYDQHAEEFTDEQHKAFVESLTEFTSTLAFRDVDIRV
jgi:hypothetical protein